MAIPDQRLPPIRGEFRSTPGSGRHDGRDSLAEVIMIRSRRAHGRGLFGSLVTKARVIASPRVQAASVRLNPRPPSSPASRSHPPPPAPNDAA